jgi:uncharacterized membrane protein YfcA
MNTVNEKTKKNALILPISALSGFCNALLGAGGGILLSVALGALFKNEMNDRREILVNSQAAMVPACFVSCLLYAINGSYSFADIVPYALPSVIGGMIGAMILPRVSSGRIGWIFALFVIWSGIRMLF